MSTNVTKLQNLAQNILTNNNQLFDNLQNELHEQKITDSIDLLNAIIGLEKSLNKIILLSDKFNNQPANKYLIPDIIFTICQYLNREQTLNFLSTCKITAKCRNIFFDKYEVRWDFEKPIEFLNKCKHLINVKNTYQLDCLTNTKSIVFADMFYSLTRQLPKTLNDLTFYDYFNESIDYLFYPQESCKLPNLRNLIFGDNFNQEVNHLPLSLISLIFGNNFNKSVDNLFKDDIYKLEKLAFGQGFNRFIVKLPSSLIELALGGKFNEPIDHLFCQKKSLEHLKFLNLGDRFNQSITNMLLPNLETLIFGHLFNQPIDQIFAPKLKIIFFGYKFDQSINDLPDSVESIIFRQSHSLLYFNQQVTHLPKNIKRIHIQGNKRELFLNANEKLFVKKIDFNMYSH